MCTSALFITLIFYKDIQQYLTTRFCPDFIRLFQWYRERESQLRIVFAKSSRAPAGFLYR